VAHILTIPVPLGNRPRLLQCKPLAAALVVVCVISGGIVTFFYTYYKVSTGIWLSRLSYGMRGAFEHQHA
jgi:hypothetical protein